MTIQANSLDSADPARRVTIESNIKLSKVYMNILYMHRQMDIIRIEVIISLPPFISFFYNYNSNAFHLPYLKISSTIAAVVIREPMQVSNIFSCCMSTVAIPIEVDAKLAPPLNPARDENPIRQKVRYPKQTIELLYYINIEIFSFILIGFGYYRCRNEPGKTVPVNAIAEARSPIDFNREKLTLNPPV